jgi:hypothetical protein
MSMSDLYDVLKHCAERVDRYRQLRARVGESNTKAGLIEPVIAALGWDVLDPDEVHREYRRRPVDNPVDYALLLLRTPRLFIEAKGLGENLDDPRWANQTISYAAVAGVEWVALTDGAEWRVFNAHAPVPIEQKLFRAVRVEDIDAALDLLGLLSKDNMRDNRIEELWRGFFVDRQVNAALADMFSDAEPSEDVVDLVAKRVPQLSRDEVRSSLMRARATFDFPSATASATPGSRPVVTAQRVDDLEPTPAATHSRPPRPTPAATPTGRPRKQRVTADERKLTVRDVIATGLLAAGTRLEAEYLGQQHTAELLDDGRVRYAGEVHGALSAAGRAAKIATSGSGTPESTLSTDGWDFWRARHPRTGQLVKLKELRRQAAAGHG